MHLRFWLLYKLFSQSMPTKQVSEELFLSFRWYPQSARNWLKSNFWPKKLKLLYTGWFGFWRAKSRAFKVFPKRAKIVLSKQIKLQVVLEQKIAYWKYWNFTGIFLKNKKNRNHLNLLSAVAWHSEWFWRFHILKRTKIPTREAQEHFRLLDRATQHRKFSWTARWDWGIR